MFAHCAVDGGNKADRREEHEAAVKTNRAGKAGRLRRDRGDYLCAFYFCTQGCGRAERPAFPAPSAEGKLRKTRTLNAARSLMAVLSPFEKITNESASPMVRCMICGGRDQG
jgi:hypothetical protein